ncbi:hypothetical protein UlMin_027698 [Ulmus minor]
MAFSVFFLLLSLLFQQAPFCSANVHKLNLLRPHPISQSNSFQDNPPTQFFEVTKPIQLPRTKPCSHLILQHDFGYTYGSPPVFASYNPPSNCPSHNFAKIVLEWKATCKGRQFDRIFGVWLGGVELLRSCTAEPTASGIVWSVQKDITRYYSLLMKNQTLAVFLGNIVDSTYTGVYHVNITLNFYPAEKSLNNYGSNSENLASGLNSWADLILPISRNQPLNDGFWFEIVNSTNTQLKEFKIPQNSYRAVLEVYVSFHENDEFWYSNLPNEYIAKNNLTDTPGNGPFREVVISLDGEIVGAIWPFTVIYTGGMDPLLWRPISGIGSFDLPSYDIEITPFLGKILDGKFHKCSFSVTNALNVWFIDANLHLWLDKKSPKVEGKLLSHKSFPLSLSQVLDFKGLNGTFLTTATRSVASTGWVKSSFGTVVTRSVQDFYYTNSLVMANDGNVETVNQTIYFSDTIVSEIPFSHVFTIQSRKTFPLYLYSGYLDQGNEDHIFAVNVTLGFNEKKSFKGSGFEISSSSLRNLQNGEGYMLIRNGSIVGSSGNTQQVYSYVNEKSCYFRNISSSNYKILYDVVRNTCSEDKVSLDFGLTDLVLPHSEGVSSM